MFASIEKELSERVITSKQDNIKYVIKILKQNIYKCVLMKAIAIDLKDIVNNSDFGVIYLLKKAKFLMTYLYESLRKERCPFTMEMSIWLDFARSNDLKDGINFLSQELQQLDHVFADYLSSFQTYMKKFPEPDQ